MSTLSSDSELDDLPPVSEIFRTTVSEGIRPGDIVWARHQKLYWPAFVTRVNKKKRKVHFWFTDMPAVTFKRPLTKVYPFKTVKVEEFRRDAQAAGCGSEHDEVQSLAEIYINRKLEGQNDDPKKFFDPTYPFLLVEEHLKKNPSVSRELFSSMKIPHILNRDSARKSNAARTCESKSEDEAVEDEALSDSSGDQTDSETDSIDCELNVFSGQTSDSTPEESRLCKEIVDCIKSGHTNSHLFGILDGTVPSFYYEFYKNCCRSNKSLLDYVSYGPVESLDDLRELTIYLISLFDNAKEKKRKKNCLTPSTSALDDSSFISKVWLPESIVFALSEIKQMGLQQASKLFHETSRLKSAFLDFIENSNRIQSSRTRGRRGQKRRIFEEPRANTYGKNKCPMPNNNCLEDTDEKSSEVKCGSPLRSRSGSMVAQQSVSELRDNSPEI